MIASRVWLLPATVLCLLVPAAGVTRAQAPLRTASTDVVRVAALGSGSIVGVVLDEAGMPVDGVVISALGGASAFAVTDRAGQYQMTELPPGPYVVRAHREGFAAVRSSLVNVRAASRTSSSFTLRRAVLAAGVGLVDGESVSGAKDESEVAWRLRRIKRSVLKDEAAGADVFPDEDDDSFFRDSLELIGRAFSSSAAMLAGLPLYGQVNFLTAAAVDDSGDLLAVGRPSGVAFLSVGAPVGDRADWTARVTMNSGDVTSWTMAGDYITRASEHQRLAVGMGYSLQRYEGGNFAALQAVPDGHRKVASLSAAYDADLTPRLTVGFGSKYEHYDYLEGYGLLSPSVRASFAITPQLRVHAKATLHQVAPGAEEFVPIWAHDPIAEKVAFEQLIRLFVAHLARFPNAHIYHYAQYEPNALKRLAMRYATMEVELDQLLRDRRFVDLYRIVRQGVRASTEAYSLKSLEQIYWGERSGEVTNAAASIVEYERWRVSQDQAILDSIAHYNKDDCVSTAQMHRWLVGLRPAGASYRIVDELGGDEREKAAERVKLRRQVAGVKNFADHGLLMGNESRAGEILLTPKRVAIFQSDFGLRRHPGFGARHGLICRLVERRR